MIAIAVRTFARYAELLGDPVLVEVASPATVAQVIQALRRLPGAEQLPERPLVAVDHAMAELTTPVTGTSRVALLPPLAGG